MCLFLCYLIIIYMCVQVIPCNTCAIFQPTKILCIYKISINPSINFRQYFKQQRFYPCTKFLYISLCKFCAIFQVTKILCIYNFFYLSIYKFQVIFQATKILCVYKVSIDLSKNSMQYFKQRFYASTKFLSISL